jgi:serine/threonine protein kinase/Flp pilus assembly protein TadD
MGEDLPPTVATDPPEEQGQDRIGPYRLLHKLGEGGMGEVWLALQTEPVRRKVALKVIKKGMDTQRVVARFEAERQALAMMDHPAIAKIFEAGETQHGRPYFVMEHVPGVPITEYCDRHKLTNQERLALFTQVCEGVQHAHQKAVIHRDLKPTNVLVMIRNDTPVPKIIDFGVAKATSHKLTDQTLQTQIGVMIGTPAYMSPEQADLTSEDVDTRTDVYSLGVMLYELLVGALPFDPQELQSEGLQAMVRRIREDDPSKPSARLSMKSVETSYAAEHRQMELLALRRELTGDLDWITMKALEKDRTRRYRSPQELADDIERYRTHQPVIARPPSAAYRTRKFILRHTGGVAISAVALVVLIAFAMSMSVQARKIAIERDRANQEAVAKGQVSDFLRGLFTVSDPSQSRGNSITARELLDRGAERIENTLIEQPETQAELRGVIGDVYRKLGLYTEAERLLEETLRQRRRILGNDHPDTLASMNSVANLYADQGRYDAAESLYLENLEARNRTLGSDHPSTLKTMNNLAILYKQQGRYDEAEPLYLETLETKKRVLGTDHPSTVTSMNNLAIVYKRQGRYDEAEPLYYEAFTTQKRVLGLDHPSTLLSMNNLAILYKIQERFDEAEPLFLDTLAMRTKIYGEEHPLTLKSANNLANLYLARGRLDEAEPLSIHVLTTQKRTLGDDHPDTLKSMNNLANLYLTQRRYEEAEPLFLEALSNQERLLGNNHISTAITRHNLACVIRDTGRPEEARRLFEQVQQFCDANLRPEHAFAKANREEYAKLIDN